MGASLSSYSSHLNKRIRHAEVVMFAASNNGVSTRFIEGHRLWVLLVDFEVGGVRKHVVEKRGTDAATAHVVMHKEHLQAALRGASETDRSPILLGDGQGDRWKIVRSELRLDGVTMCGGQKIMRERYVTVEP